MHMFSRFGLRFQMAASYVAVSAAAVLIVETVLLAIFASRMQSASDSIRKAQRSLVQADRTSTQTRVRTMAADVAATADAAVSLADSSQSGIPDWKLLASTEKYVFGNQPLAGATDSSVMRVLATLAGVVVLSSSPKVYPVGSRLPASVVGPTSNAGLFDASDQPSVWATHPVELAGSSNSARRTIGLVYVQEQASRPAVALVSRDIGGSKGQDSTQVLGAGVLWVPAVIVLILLVPVGGLFGLLSTRWLIRRIRRLAVGTSAMAGGDLQSRIPVSGNDEVGRLEQSFNIMAERLEAAVQVERDAAGSAARQAERTRITRELHDSISQDLFSASLLASGLRRALHDDLALRHQAESMERTLERTMREMRAMMLELRPVALEDAGLAAAVEELCRAYETRLGIRISTDISALHLKPPVEHAVLRVVQETLGNAARHGRPELINLSVGEADGQVTVSVRDDGQGFDLHRVSERHGMGLELMRERVAELGGQVEVTSAPEQGTMVRVLIPDGIA